MAVRLLRPPPDVQLVGRMTVRPDWKPEKRQRMSARQWERLQHTRLGLRCAVCGDPSESYHHIVRRSQGGDDTPANLLAVCGHGTRGCHSLIERRMPHVLAAVRRSLTPEQHAYVIAKKGEAWLDRAYPAPDCDVCEDLGCDECAA